MNYNQALEYIHSFERFGSKLGLERISRLLELMGNPQNKLKYVHIAGTNGKGSTTTITSNILINSGYNVGTYISPYIIDFRERIQLNGNMISKEDLIYEVENIIPFIEKLNSQEIQIKEFELITAMAFNYFYRKKCDIVCLEVGLGGRFDATNVIKQPLVSVINSISIDHTNILGDNLTEISFEKAGIIKPNCDIVLYPKQEKETFDVIYQVAKQNNSKLYMADLDKLEISKMDIYGSDFEYSGNNYKIKLAGKHQVYNAINVIEICDILIVKGYNITFDNIYNGISKTFFPARMEILSENPIVILDGAHNCSGFYNINNIIKSNNTKPKIAIIGMLADKECEKSVEIISKTFDFIITTQVSNTRTLDAQTLKNMVEKYNKNVISETEYSNAYNVAVNRAGQNGLVLIVGSLYLASDFRKKFLFNGNDNK